VLCSCCASLLVVRLATAVSVQVLPQVFHKPSADASRKLHALLRYIVFLLASTKEKAECISVFHTLFSLNVTLKFSPSFVKLAGFEKLKLRCALGISRFYMYEPNCRGVTEFLLLHILPLECRARILKGRV
jgi:hypothetical protein